MPKSSSLLIKSIILGVLIAVISGCYSPAPAEFMVAIKEVAPTEAAINENFTINIDVYNIGDTQGTYNAILEIDGKEIQRKAVTLNKRERTNILFSFASGIPGDHEIKVGDEKATVTAYELKDYTLMRDNGNTRNSTFVYDPRGQWVYFDIPGTPFYVNKIFVRGVRTDPSDVEKKYYTIKIWENEFNKELYSQNYPYTNFSTDITMVEHKIIPAVKMETAFTVDFISHSEQPKPNEKCKTGIAVSYDASVDSNQYAGYSWLGKNTATYFDKWCETINTKRACWIIQVQGKGR